MPEDKKTKEEEVELPETAGIMASMAAQAAVAAVEANKPAAGSRIITMKASEYTAMHKKNGTPHGRPKGTKTVLTTEELRILINAGWAAKDVKDKHGIDSKELEQVVWRLSKEELRDSPIKFV